MFNLLKSAFAVFAIAVAAPGANAVSDDRPTIVLVHGAFAESSSWAGVVNELTKSGYSVVAAANPLRGVASDAAYVAALTRSIKGPVVLVGHSYGGAVISAAGNGAGNVKSLVYVSAFAPDAGESCLELTGKFPGSTLPLTLAPAVPLAGEGEDLYIEQDKFAQQFAADLMTAVAPDTRRQLSGLAISAGD